MLSYLYKLKNTGSDLKNTIKAYNLFLKGNARTKDMKMHAFEKSADSRTLSSINKPAGASLFFTVSNLVAKGAAFIFTPIFTRLLTPMEYGEFSLFSSYLSVAVLVSGLEIPGAILMRALQKEKELRNLTVLTAALTTFPLIIPTVLAIYYLRFGGGLTFSYAYPCLAISAFSLNVINVYLSFSKFLYRKLPSTVITLFQSAVAPIASILILKTDVLKNLDHVSKKITTVSAHLLAIAVTLAVITSLAARKEIEDCRMSRREVLSFSYKTAGFLLKLALPLLPYYFSVMMISQTDKILISRFIGKSALAKYSVAYSAGIAPLAITSGIMGALSPWIMRKIRSGEKESVKNALDTAMTAAVPAISAFLCFAPDVFNFLAPENYSEALPVLFIISLIPIPLSLAQCASSAAISKERVLGVLTCGIIPAVFSLCLNFIIVKRAPVWTLAIVSCTAYLLLSLLQIVNLKRSVGINIVSIKATLIKLLLLALIAGVIYAAKDILYLRIALFLASSLYLLCMQKRVFSLLREKKEKSGSLFDKKKA